MIKLRALVLALVLPLHGCLFYSSTSAPKKPIYYGAITAAEVGVAALGGYAWSHPHNPSPSDSRPSFTEGTLTLLGSFVVIDLILFGLSKAID